MMAASASALTSLRELIGTTASGYRNRSSLSFSLLEEGIPKGALTEISGPGKTEFLVRFLSEHPSLKVAWIEDRISIFPYAIFQRRGQLQRMLFAEAGNNSHWALMQILRSQVFGLIVFSSTTTTPLCNSEDGGGIGQESYRALFEEKSLRAMQLSAEKSQAAVVFLRDEPGDSWPISLQVRIGRMGRGSVEVLKRRY
jgi:hypothetical protein